jgi:hypothetical protein
MWMAGRLSCRRHDETEYGLSLLPELQETYGRVQLQRLRLLAASRVQGSHTKEATARDSVCFWRSFDRRGDDMTTEH